MLTRAVEVNTAAHVTGLYDVTGGPRQPRLGSVGALGLPGFFLGAFLGAFLPSVLVDRLLRWCRGWEKGHLAFEIGAQVFASFVEALDELFPAPEDFGIHEP